MVCIQREDQAEVAAEPQAQAELAQAVAKVVAVQVAAECALEVPSYKEMTIQIAKVITKCQDREAAILPETNNGNLKTNDDVSMVRTIDKSDDWINKSIKDEILKWKIK